MFGSSSSLTPTSTLGSPGVHAVQWYYYLQNDPRRRMPDGWYEYDAHINLTVEQHFQSSQRSAGTTRSNKKLYMVSIVASSGYQYEIDFSRLVQRNSASGKERPIFRTANGQPPPRPPPSLAPVSVPVLAQPTSVHRTHTAPPTYMASALPVSAAVPPMSLQGSRSRARGSNREQLLSYVAPEFLHEAKLEDDKIFVDVPIPHCSPKAGEREEKKNGKPTYSKAKKDDDCVICLDSLWGDSPDRVVAIQNCGHRFHYQCIHEALTKGGGKCPLCSKSIAHEEGAQTSKGKCPSATMLVRTNHHRQCQGHNDVGTIEISYRIPSAKQKKYHPQPDFPFNGASRTAYIPNNQEGQDLLSRLQYAFMHGLSFMVGTSLTTGQANTVTWASIHHKTSASGGLYGYPDPTYFNRCNDELNQLNVPTPVVCRMWLQNNSPGCHAGIN